MIPSPSPSVKIQIIVGNVLPLHLKQTFPPIIWIFTEGEGDGIEYRLSFKFFSTLQKQENGRALGQTVIFLSSTLGCLSFKAEQAEFSRKSIGSFNAPPLPAPLAATAALV